jgi:hypothetical protein
VEKTDDNLNSYLNQRETKFDESENFNSSLSFENDGLLNIMEDDSETKKKKKKVRDLIKRYFSLILENIFPSLNY